MTIQTSQLPHPVLLGWWQHHGPLAARLVLALLPSLFWVTAAWPEDPGPAWSPQCLHQKLQAAAETPAGQ